MLPNRTQKKRKSRARPYTPPSEFQHTNKKGHIKTPARFAIIGFKLLEQLTGNPISCELVQKVTSVASRSQSRVISSHEARTCHNIPDSGPDPRERKKALT